MIPIGIDLYQGDCLEVMDRLIEQGVKVDAIITDTPYGTTACKWDSIIPFDKMWEKLKLLRNDSTPIVLFGSEPFSSALRMSNIKEYKYDWVWDKIRGVGHLNSKKRPMICTENILIFYNKQTTYNPQMRERDKPRKSQNNATQKVFGKSRDNFVGNTYNKKFPINMLTFSKSNMVENNFHPTQKPIALLEYLINTYTNEGDTVLDFTMGSGSTGVACINTGRNFIGIELDEQYFNIAKQRIEGADNGNRFNNKSTTKTD